MSRLRTLLEKVSDRFVLERHLPAEFGGRRVCVTPGSALKYWRFDLGKIDPDLLRLVRVHVRPGAKVWDIGANVGLFAFAAAGVVGPEGRVVAIEPDTRLVEIMRKSLRLPENIFLRLDVLPVSVAGALGVGYFHIAARGRSANHLAVALGSSQAGGVSVSYPVVTLTLDWLLEQYGPPDLVKIDVEGAEHLVLEGGKRLLGEARPIILCEVSGHNSSFISGLLKEYRYTLFDWEKNDDVAIAQATFNTLALPQR
ncbi:MAG: FkbM family methyltransferase [Magnetococcales bacterium]|nr:FkbM family methyltransferase [Magnetococcales bacterium]